MSTDQPPSTDRGPSGIGRLSVSALAWIKQATVAWSLALALLLALDETVGVFDTRASGILFRTTLRWIFLALLVVSVVLTRWSNALGGALGAFTTAGLAVVVYEQLVGSAATLTVLGFAAPTVAWIFIALHDRRRLAPWMVFGLAGLSALAGFATANQLTINLLGPTHPESSIESLPSGSTNWIWSGGVTAESAVVTATVDDDIDPGTVLLRWSATDLDAGQVTAPASVSGLVYRFELSGLAPATDHVYALEIDDVVDVANQGAFTTFPTGPSSFTLAFGACARTLSNGAVFDAIRSIDPLAYVIMGDFHYGDRFDPDLSERRELMDLTLTRPAQAALYRSTPVAYMWDDHDYGGNDAHRYTAARTAAMDVYRQYVPHYELAGEFTPIHQAFSAGRVRVVITDTRSSRTPTPTPDGLEPTLLGNEQRAWLLDELERSARSHAVVLWVNSVPWIAEPDASADHWGGYPEERRLVADFIATNDIDNLIMVSGDAHMVAIDDGTNSDYSTDGPNGASAPSDPDSTRTGFPVLHAAALDRPGSIKGGPYTHGPIPGGGQFGTVEVVDEGGSEVTVRMSALDWRGEELLTLSETIDASHLDTGP